ncbi:MAG TPA: protease HtpX [Oligoflexia bacterium]|nr:protease HtpX [Oligoflexia bacterium]HMP26409.1 protease HtpX [Oligoflexia bacterium]
MFKRITLFLLTNLLVILTISILLQVLGVRPYLTANGIDFSALMIFCLIWGFTGSFISLLLSKQMAKWAMGVKVIDPERSSDYDWLIQTVTNQARAAGLRVSPEVGVYNSPEINAFATGPTKNNSLVAVSTGLLNYMNKEEAEGVLAHEVAHIANGDMVTMTLIQGVVNSFVLFLSRLLGFVVSQGVKEESRAMVRMIVTILLDILLGILGMLVVAYFSRMREYKADAGSARIAGRDKMIAALEALKRNAGLPPPQLAASKGMQALMISSGERRNALSLLFSTHPPLTDRIEALKNFA